MAKENRIFQNNFAASSHSSSTVFILFVKACLSFSSDHYFEFITILIRNVAGNGYSHGLQHNLISSDNWLLSLRSQTTRCHRVRLFACNAKNISRFWIRAILSETRRIILNAAKCEALHSVTQLNSTLSFLSRVSCVKSSSVPLQ